MALKGERPTKSRYVPTQQFLPVQTSGKARLGGGMAAILLIAVETYAAYRSGDWATFLSNIHMVAGEAIAIGVAVGGTVYGVRNKVKVKVPVR